MYKKDLNQALDNASDDIPRRKLVDESDSDSSVLTTDNKKPLFTTDAITQWSLYFITYGVMLEISLMVTRYKRSNENHDEIHAAQMIQAFMIAFCTDIWYIIEEKGHWFKDIFYSSNFVCIVAINQNVLLQILYGNKLRDKMRDEKSQSSKWYYQHRNVHMYSGYCLSALTKLRLLLVSIIEMDRQGKENEQVNSWTYSDGFKLAVAIWVFMIFCARIPMEVIVFFGGKTFRNPRIDKNKTHFNHKQKKQHKLILEALPYTDSQAITNIFKDNLLIFVEDRIFDIKDLDHPGGRFIFNRIKGREVSRYFFGSQKFEFLNCDPHQVWHKHSPFAQNYQEDRFIGLLPDLDFFMKKKNNEDNIDAMIEKGNQNEDRSAIDFMPAIDTLQSENDTKNQLMKNVRSDYDWSIAHNKFVTQNLHRIDVTCDNQYDINLNQQPLKNWGKFFNIRSPQYARDIRQYSLVLSIQPYIKVTNKKILLRFTDYLPEYKKIDIISSQLSKFKKDQFSELVDETENIIVEDQPNTLSLMVKRRKQKKMSGLLTSKDWFTKKEKFSIRGPFGRGIELHRNTHGHIVIMAQGTGVLPFIDLFYFIARKLMQLTLKKRNIDKKKMDYLDAFKEDLDITFENNIKFSFYQTFASEEEYSAQCKQSIETIRAIQKREGIVLVEKILLKVSESVDREIEVNETVNTGQNQQENLENSATKMIAAPEKNETELDKGEDCLIIYDKRVFKQNLGEILGLMGCEMQADETAKIQSLNIEDDEETLMNEKLRKVERIIVAGDTLFCRHVYKGATKALVPLTRLHFI